MVDCAHGAAYKVVPEALWELGADVIAIGVEPDGFNINKECGSTAPEALGRKVREMRADIGIALDGDADRVIIIDERGHVVDGDQLLAVIAESWKDDGRLAKPGVVATVMSNLGLERYLEGHGLKLIRTQVGDRYVLEQMLAQQLQRRRRAVRPHHPVRLQHHRRRLRRRAAGARGGAEAQPPGVRSLPSLRSAAADPEERALPQRQAARRSVVKSAIVDGEKRLNGHGRLLVRASGTEPVIRVMGEGDDRILVEEVVDHIVVSARRRLRPNCIAAII